MSPETIWEMYRNTVPLFIENIDLFASVIGIDVKEDDIVIEPFLRFDRLKSELNIDYYPMWFTRKFQKILEKEAVNRNIAKTQGRERPKITKKRERGI